MSNQSMIFVRVIALGLTLALMGCGGGGSGSSTTALLSAPQGTLGGSNIALTVTAAGGSIKLPCGSSGTITGPLTLDASGHFTASGTVTPIVGGAQPAGSGPTPYAAVFTGTTDGKTLNLTITPDSSTGVPPTSYVLTYGATPTFTAACPG